MSMKRKFFIIIAILISGTITLVSQPLNKAQELFEQKRTSEAIATLQPYLQSNPKDENAFVASEIQKSGFPKSQTHLSFRRSSIQRLNLEYVCRPF